MKKVKVSVDELNYNDVLKARFIQYLEVPE